MFMKERQGREPSSITGSDNHREGWNVRGAWSVIGGEKKILYSKTMGSRFNELPSAKQIVLIHNSPVLVARQTADGKKQLKPSTGCRLDKQKIIEAVKNANLTGFPQTKKSLRIGT